MSASRAPKTTRSWTRPLAATVAVVYGRGGVGGDTKLAAGMMSVTATTSVESTASVAAALGTVDLMKRLRRPCPFLAILS